MTHKCTVNVKEKDHVRFSGTTTFCTRLKGKFLQAILISANNPLCAMYFRSETAVREEKLQQLTSPDWCILHPLSKFRQWYDIYITAIYIMVLGTKPIDASMNKSELTLAYGYRLTSTVLDILCMHDIFITFYTGYVVRKTKTIEMRPSKIARHYVFSPFFICDVLSSIPVLLLSQYEIITNRFTIGLLNVFVLLKVVRIYTVINQIYKISHYLRIRSKGSVFLTCAIFLMLVILHWTACLQIAVRRTVRFHFSPRPQDYDTRALSKGFPRKNFHTKYTQCLFRSSAYLLGIRLDIYNITRPEDYILTIITYVLGKILIAFTWIIVAVSIMNSRSMDIKFFEIINQLDEYMRQKQLPMNLRQRISQYYNFKYQKKYFKEDLINGLLSDRLKKDINLHVCRSLIESVSLFAELTPDQVSEVVGLLIPEIFLPKDTIIQSGTPGDAMYFLESGTVAVYTHSGKEVCHLEDGAYFGEISIVLKGQQRTATIIAIEISKVYRLKRRDFERCLLKHKGVFKKMLFDAERRLKEILQMEENYKKALFEKTYQGKEGDTSGHTSGLNILTQGRSSAASKTNIDITLLK